MRGSALRVLLQSEWPPMPLELLRKQTNTKIQATGIYGEAIRRGSQRHLHIKVIMLCLHSLEGHVEVLALISATAARDCQCGMRTLAIEMSFNVCLFSARRRLCVSTRRHEEGGRRTAWLFCLVCWQVCKESSLSQRLRFRFLSLERLASLCITDCGRLEEPKNLNSKP